MSLTAVLTLFLFLLPLAASAGSTISSDVLSAYDALEGFNFPMGLLPKGALATNWNQPRLAEGYLCPYVMDDIFRIR
ncbi:hypothetical protein CJ030_MR2G019482 [Morella rubra]|uniref:Uncharacterized protein n=1 Tax=Morella rubra TaxID=262757 RepID=A0A6A1WDM6_9ROSI|nr:hypothetical protein CJ030_MR2G019482 [Morella rubra]